MVAVATLGIGSELLSEAIESLHREVRIHSSVLWRISHKRNEEVTTLQSVCKSVRKNPFRIWTTYLDRTEAAPDSRWGMRFRLDR